MAMRENCVLLQEIAGVFPKSGQVLGSLMQQLAFLTKAKICHFGGTVCPCKRVLDN